MRILIFTISLFLSFSSCKSDETETNNNEQINSHKVVVLEVLQTNNYTYLLVEESGAETWLAVPKMAANKGETYYYDGGMLMENFVSKDLNRTFEKVYFLEGVRKTAEVPVSEVTTDMNPHNAKPEIEKAKITIETVKGGISIGELYSKKADYNGKTVKVKGVVVKFNPEIMQKNWIHIQDGTDFEGEFDLTLTTGQVVKNGDTIVVEGKIALDKDFGFGYFYKVIMEEAVVK